MAKDITRKTKAPIEKHALGVTDRAMQSLQQTIARMAARSGKGDWAKLLDKAVSAYNNTTNEAVRDAPADVIEDTESGRTLQFMALKDNVAKFRHNHSLTQRRKKQLASVLYLSSIYLKLR